MPPFYLHGTSINNPQTPFRISLFRVLLPNPHEAGKLEMSEFMRLQGKRLCAVLVGVVVLALAGCKPAQQTEASAPSVRVTVLTIEPATLAVHDELPGRVAAVRTAEIRPQVSGIVQKRLFEQGTEIRVGTALFQIRSAPFKAEVDSAAAALQRAQAVFDRARVQAERLAPLVQAEAVSQQAYDDAVSQQAQAAADVAQARSALSRRALDLKFATVDAPISGRVDQALVSEGALVSSNDAVPMATIQQIDQVYVDVRQSADALERLSDALDRRSGTDDRTLPVQILKSSGQPYGLDGRVLFSGISVDAGTGDVLLRVLVDNPRRRLLPGMYVKARVQRAHYADALMVPQQAVTRTAGQPGVWVVDARQQPHRVAVEVGELVGGRYRIASGLSAGQRVVIEGGERLSDGVQVETRDWQAAAPHVAITAR